MTVRVAHDFVSAVPDGDDATVVRPSNWNADHVIEGLGTAAEADVGDFAAAVHTHAASDVTDFDTEVSNNADVAANTAARHAAVTVTDSAEIDFTLTGQDITASLKAGSIDETKLDASVNASLDLADSAVQPAAIADMLETSDIGVSVQAHSSVLDNTTASFTTDDESKLDGIETGADVTDATNVAAAGAVMESDTSTASMSFVVDEDDMASNSDTKVPTQQSVKAYVDANAGADLTTAAFDQSPTGDHWSDEGSPRLHDISDRVFIGGGAKNVWKGYTYSAGVTTGSWIMEDITPSLRFMEKGAQLAVFSSVGGPSYISASRMSDNDLTSTSPYCSAGSQLVYNDVAGPTGAQTTTSHKGAWGQYTEAYRIQGAGPALGQEIEIANMGDEATFYTSYGARYSGDASRALAFGLGIGSGAEQAGNLTLYDATAAIYITGNGKRFRSGIVFVSQSLTGHAADGSGVGRALEFAIGMEQVWTYSTGANARSLTIGATGGDASKQTIFRAESGSARFRTVRSDLTTETNAGLSVIWPTLTGAQDINGVAIQPAASGASSPVVFQAAGADSLIGIAFRPKGAAAVSLQDQSGNARVAVNATGIGFYGATPSAKPTITGSRGGNAALADLLTKLATLGILTDSTS